MGALIALVIIVEWVGLGLAGKRLARKLENPDAWVMPLLLGGVLGVAVMLLAHWTRPLTPVRTQAQDQRIGAGL